MYYDDRARTFNFITGLALGAVIGAAIALLAAPRSGKSARRKLIKAVGSRGPRWEDLSDEMRSAVRAGRRRLNI